MPKQELTDIEPLPRGVIEQRGSGLYAITPRTPLGEVSAETLDTVNRVVRKYGLPGIRVTAGQRLMLRDIPARSLEGVLADLGPVGETCTFYVQACPGTTACRMAMRDSMAMGARLEKFLDEFILPAKLKAGVAGCSMCCAESFVRDVGLVGKRNGWTVVFGGNAGKNVRRGDVLAENADDGEALAVIGRALAFYRDNGKPRERTARFVERVSVQAVRDAVFGVAAVG